MHSNIYVRACYRVALQTHIAELGEVSPANWAVLVVLVALNYFRGTVIRGMAFKEYIYIGACMHSFQPYVSITALVHIP